MSPSVPMLPPSETETKKYQIAALEGISGKVTLDRIEVLRANELIDPGFDIEIEGYEILELLGRGGMGVVYKARHRELNRIVALKMILNGAQATEEDRQRFLIEAQSVAQLRHPNIVPIHDIGRCRNTLYFSLEYVSGGTLYARINGTPQSAEFTATIVAQLAEGIQHAHEFGIVHRDLKPANILLSENCSPIAHPSSSPMRVGPLPDPLSKSGTLVHSTLVAKITDFGLAKRIDNDLQLTATGMVAGTPSYMAPEQIQTDRIHGVGPAADIYALGAIFYEMLTGRPPFLGNSAVEIMNRVTREEPLSPSVLQPGVPRDLATISLKCLEKDPNRRYSSAAELAADLHSFLKGEPILARPVGPCEKWSRWARRNPAIAGSMAGSIFVILLAFALVTSSYLEAKEQRKEAETKGAEAIENFMREREARYRANLAVAGQAIYNNNSAKAKTALSDAPEEFRGWEWSYFSVQLDRSRSAFSSSINRFALTRDRKKLGIPTADGRVEIRELPSGKVLARSEPRPGIVKILQFSPDAETLVEGDLDGEVRLVDAKTLAINKVLRGHAKEIGTVEFSADGTRLMTDAIDENKPRLWEAKTGKLLGASEEVSTCCCLNRDGIGVVMGGEDGVRLWDGKNEPRFIAHLPGIVVRSMCWSSDHKLLAVATFHPDQKVYIWEASTQTIIATVGGHTNTIASVQFSPDGTQVASASLDQTVRLSHSRTGELIAQLQGHTGQVQLVFYNSDGSKIVSCSTDQTIRLWDVTTGQLLEVLRGHEELVHYGSFACDDRLIITRAGNGTVRIWDTSLFDSHLFRGHRSYVYDVAVSPDDRLVASVGWDDYMLHLWDAKSGRLLKRFKHAQSVISSVSFNRTGELLVTLSRDKNQKIPRQLSIWDVGSGDLIRQIALEGQSYGDSRAVFSPTMDRIAVAEATGRIRLFDTDGEESATYSGLKHLASDVAFSPDGSLLAAGYSDGSIVLLDGQTLHEIAILGKHQLWVHCLMFSPDGKQLISGSADRTMWVWDVQKRQPIQQLEQGKTVYGLAFHPTEPRLAVACEDGTIRIWNTTSRKEVAELVGHSQYVHAVSFSKDGERLFSGSGDATIRVWDTRSVKYRAESEWYFP